MYAHEARPHERLYDNLYPLAGALTPKSNRLAVAQGVFSDIQTDLVSTPVEELLTNAGLLRDAAAYCLRSVYLSACERENGTCDQQARAASTDELHDLGATILRGSSFLDRLRDGHSRVVRGAVSEIAVATTLITGITEGHIPPGFVVLGSSRFDRGYFGLPNDVDLRGNVGGKPLKMQVKTSPASVSATYKDGIVVVSSVQIARAAKPTANSPLTLLSKVVNGSSDRRAAYNFLNRVLPRPARPKRRTYN